METCAALPLTVSWTQLLADAAFLPVCVADETGVRGATPAWWSLVGRRGNGDPVTWTDLRCEEDPAPWETIAAGGYRRTAWRCVDGRTVRVETSSWPLAGEPALRLLLAAERGRHDAERVRWLERLADLEAAFALDETEGAVLDRVLGVSRQLLGSERGLVFVRNGASSCELRRTTGLGEGEISQWRRSAVRFAALGRGDRRRRSRLMMPPHPASSPAYRLAPGQGVVLVPLGVARETGGTLVALVDETAPPDASTLALLAAAGQAAGQALERLRLLLHEAEARETVETAVRRAAASEHLVGDLGRAATPEAVARVLVEHADGTLGAEGIVVGLVEEGAVRIVGSGGGERGWAALGLTVPVGAAHPLTEPLRVGGDVWLEDPEGWAGRWPALPAGAPRVRAALPLVIDEQIVGTMLLTLAEGTPAHEEQRDFLRRLLPSCAQALDRARLLGQERAARAAAEASSQAKEHFLSVMSHELRTPLTTIAGYLDLLEMGIQGEVSEGQQRAFEAMRRSQRQLTRLINDLLDLRRIETGQLALSVDRVPIVAVVRQIIDQLQPSIRAGGIVLAGPEGASRDLCVLADGERLQQILINLIGNAIKFTPPEGHVTVRCEEGAGRVRVLVGDTGPGIPADRRESIFEPFVRLPAADGRRIEGLGLGLPISRDLARAMHGDITVVSPAEGGSLFVLDLPAG